MCRSVGLFVVKLERTIFCHSLSVSLLSFSVNTKLAFQENFAVEKEFQRKTNIKRP